MLLTPKEKNCRSVGMGMSPGSILPIPFSSHLPPSILPLRPQNDTRHGILDGWHVTERRGARQDKEWRTKINKNCLCHLCLPHRQSKKEKESMRLKKLKQRKSWTKPEDKHENILGLHFSGGVRPGSLWASETMP